MNSFTHVSSSVKTRIRAKDFILLSSVYFSMQGILTPLTNQQLLLWQTSACFQHCLVWKSKLEVHSPELWGTTKASGNSVNYLVNILLRKDAINKYEITAIKDPICLREEYVICGSICFSTSLARLMLLTSVTIAYHCAYIGFKYHSISDKLVLVNNSNWK